MPDAPYLELIERDPGRLRIALSHEWGDYRATPHIVAELERPPAELVEPINVKIWEAGRNLSYTERFRMQAAQARDGLLQQLAAQIERALGGRWNDGRRPGVHVARPPTVNPGARP